MKVAVVGGGVVGLAVAHSLRRRGAEVVVVERDRCGGATSLGNAGWITPGLSGPLPEPGVMWQSIKWMFDRDSPLLVRPRLDPSFLKWSVAFARACRGGPHRRGLAATLALARAATDDFDALAADGVEFEMHADGLLYLARSEHELEHYAEMYDALRAMGWDGAVDVYDREGVRAFEPAVADGVTGGLHGARERSVRPETVTEGLAAHLRAQGAEIAEGVEVRELVAHDGGWEIRTGDGAIEADRVVVAAGVWSRALLAPLGVRLPLEAAKGYSVTAAGSGTPPRRPLYLTEIKLGATPFDGAFRLAGTLELAGIDLTLNRGRIDAIVRGARHYLRDWDPVEHRVDWAGLRPVASDGLPIIGAVPGHAGLFVATGHAMLGVTLAPSTGEALAPLVLGDADGAPALAGLSPARFTRV